MKLRNVVAGAALAFAATGAVPGGALAASEACTAPTITVVDGWHRNTFLRLVAERNPEDPRTTWVCFRVRDELADRGGRIDVTEPGVSPTLPSVDAQSAACSTTSPNAFPGPRPLVRGQIGSETEPPYVPFLVDAYLAPFELWTCLSVGGVDARLKVSAGGIAPPAVNVVPDAPGTSVAPARPGPAGYPSSTCFESVPYSRIANMSVGGGHVWAHLKRESSTRIAACLRVERPGQQPIGYRVYADTNGTPGVTPVIHTATDTTPCTIPVVEVEQPIPVRLARSPRDANPASVCISTSAAAQRLTIGTTGTLTAPEAGIEKDPDSA